MTVISWILVVLLAASIVCTALVCGENKELKKTVSRIVELRDKKPASDKVNAAAMQLSNEISAYIREDGDEIVVSVLKPEE